MSVKRVRAGSACGILTFLCLILCVLYLGVEEGNYEYLLVANNVNVTPGELSIN